MNKLKLISPYVFLSAFVILFSCGDGKTKDADKKGDDDKTKSSLVKTAPVVDLSSVTNTEELLSQNWELEEDVEELKQGGGGNIRMPFRGLHLAFDKTALKNPRTDMASGKWSYNDADKTLTLSLDKGGKDVYVVKSVKKNELNVTKKGEDAAKVLKFAGPGFRYQQKEDDPYYISNSSWRTKPAHAETDTAIKKRLKDGVHFLILYYKDVITRDSKLISFYGFPACLQFFGPGIATQKESELDPNWIACFFNKEDAMKAYRMMNTVLKNQFDWSNEKKVSWVQKNAAVLEQIYSKM